MFVDRTDRILGVILRTLLGSNEGLVAPRDDPLHPRGVRPEGRRHLRCVQHTETPGGARSHIEETPPCLPGRNHQLHRCRDRVTLLADRPSHGLVFGVDEIDDLQGRKRVDATRVRVALLGEAIVQHGFRGWLVRRDSDTP